MSPAMTADTRELRKRIVDTALGMNAAGINRGKSGNVSARIDGGFLITPSGLPYADTTTDDIVAVDETGTASGTRKPSSEWRFHLDIYRARPQAAAIVHAHSPFATTLACLDRGIPAFHYMPRFAAVAPLDVYGMISFTRAKCARSVR